MKNRMVFVMAAILSVGSCMVEPDNPDQMVFYADAAGTRTSLQSDGSVIWQPKDLISIYHNDYHGQFASTNTTPSASVEFKGTVPNFVRDENQYFYAFYPYSKELTTEGSVYGIPLPSEQTAVEGTFADDLFISAARTKDDRLHFHNVCGGVKFSVAEDGIKKVVFKANGGESIAGKLKIEFDSDGIPVLSSVDDGSSSVTLTAPDQGTFQKGEWYYLVLAPGTLGKGYTIEFYDQEMVGKVSSGDPVQVKRSVWGVLAGLEPENAFAEGTIEVSKSQLDFYSMADQGTTKSLEIRNTGTKPVTIHAVTCEGPFSSDLTAGVTIGVGGKLSMNVTLSASGTGSGSGKVTIVYGASQTMTVDVSYMVFAYGISIVSEDFKPSLRLDGDCEVVTDKGYWEVFHNFEYVPVGETDGSSIEIKNEGTTDLRVIVFGNPECFYFSKNNEPVDKVVSPGRRTSIDISFVPTEKKEYSGVFHIILFDADDPGSNYACFPYYLSAISKDITALYLTKKSLEFSSLLARYETASMSLQVRNQGDYPADITVVCPEGYTVSESHFTLDAPIGSHPQYTKDLTVTFNPQHAGTFSGKLVFEGDNLYYGPFEVELTGKAFDLERDFANFGGDVLWAGCNLGASSPTGYGSYYAWGETAPKSSYTMDNHQYYDPATGQYTKYISTRSNETLESVDDAATQKDPHWRIPTIYDWRNLSDRTTRRQVTIDGVKGMMFVGSRDPYQEQAIFFPFAGGYDGASLESRGSQGIYWSSTSYSDKKSAYSYWMEEGSISLSTNTSGRHLGFTIRPVYSEVPVSDIVFSETDNKLMVGSMRQLVPQVLPANAANKELTWSSSNESVATVTSTGFVKGISTGSATITATSVGSGVKTGFVVTVVPVAVPEMVDLGLSVKWASFNVGAFSPEQTGDYYAWGEVEPKDYYDWKSYKWSEGTAYELTKYCPSSSNGFNGYSDLKKTLEAQDDVAHVRYGGKWRMPTKAELDELASCSWVYGTREGVEGYYVYGPNSNKVSIFIPLSGYRSKDGISSASYGCVWSSSLSGSTEATHFYGSRVRSNYRYLGMTVRAVAE